MALVLAALTRGQRESEAVARMIAEMNASAAAERSNVAKALAAAAAATAAAAERADKAEREAREARKEAREARDEARRARDEAKAGAAKAQRDVQDLAAWRAAAEKQLTALSTPKK